MLPASVDDDDDDDGFMLRHMKSPKARVAIFHLCISMLVACVAAIAVFHIWFPAPYDTLSGGTALFLLISSIDIVLGPVLTWIVFNPTKKNLEKYFDLTVIALLQISALIYGLHTTYLARPIYLVLEVDRFVVVTAGDVSVDDLSKAPAELQDPEIGAVKMIGLRKIADPAERMRSVELALAGKDVSLRPEYWQKLSADNFILMKKSSKPLSDLLNKSSFIKDDAISLAEKNQTDIADMVYLPVVGKKRIWSAVLNRNSMSLLGFLKVDGF